MEELKNELEKLGRDVVEGPSESHAAAAPQRRRAPQRKAAAAAAASTVSDIDLVAADMSIKQLQQALAYHHVEPPKGAKKAALVKMLDKVRSDSERGPSGLAGGLSAMAASATSTNSADAHGPRQSTRKKRPPPAAVAQKRKQKPTARAAPASKRKKSTKRGASTEVVVDDMETETEEADPILVAGEMAATAVKQLDYNELMKACEVRGLEDPWLGKDEL